MSYPFLAGRVSTFWVWGVGPEGAFSFPACRFPFPARWYFGLWPKHAAFAALCIADALKFYPVILIGYFLLLEAISSTKVFLWTCCATMWFLSFIAYDDFLASADSGKVVAGSLRGAFVHPHIVLLTPSAISAAIDGYALQEFLFIDYLISFFINLITLTSIFSLMWFTMASIRSGSTEW